MIQLAQVGNKILHISNTHIHPYHAAQHLIGKQESYYSLAQQDRFKKIKDINPFSDEISKQISFVNTISTWHVLLGNQTGRRHQQNNTKIYQLLGRNCMLNLDNNYSTKSKI